MQIHIDDKNAKIIFQKLRAKGKDLRPAMYLIANALENSVKENFREGGRYKEAGSIHGGSEKWEPAKYPPRGGDGKARGSTLLRSGNLMKSITPSHDGESAAVSSGLVYARIQNFGGKTKPHDIIARNGKSLAFTKGGKTVLCRSVHHPGSDIPARPFMVIQQDDIEYAKETLADYLLD